MVNEYSCLPPEERVKFSLRALYERYDYHPYRMSQFEEYSLYAENRSFLQSPRVSHAAQAPSGTEKLYYTENVFRPSAQSRAFKEISQIGVEAIGEIDLYQTAEVVALAAMSLERIAPQALLEISHVGFTVGLLDALALFGADRANVLAALAAKNRSALAQAADAAGLSPEDRAAHALRPGRLYA